ncbi:GNAT family N-acetyltransferase [Brucella sp. 2280]|uniref:GNAT family N-acetyltransferase n=1 Tax=Brucella sp. 2280 TaxID=2592625 RepID=UPI001297F338|nr:GNAT family N-acetyltransferase [Brucella sp. 2280]QGA55848.1 GNAT family N-acetyltransferase [Brucella sp. 2280]
MIRRATQADIPAIVSLGRQFYQSADFEIEASAAWFSMAVSTYIQDAERLCIVYDIGCVKGFLMACYGQSDLFPIMVADEQLLYVSPDARGTAWTELRQAFEQWAKNKGCKRVQLTAQNVVKPELMTRLYRRSGYTLADLVFFKNI